MYWSTNAWGSFWWLTIALGAVGGIVVWEILKFLLRHISIIWG